MMKIFQHIWVAIIIAIGFNSVNGQIPDPDNIEAIQAYLTKERKFILGQDKLPNHQRAEWMLRLGLWKEAANLLNQDESNSPEIRLAKSRYALLNNRFEEAEDLVNQVLEETPQNHDANLMKAELEIEAWRLDKAEDICTNLLKDDSKNEKTVLLLGRVQILKKNYTRALALAQQVQQWNPKNAGGFYLEADVHFWNQAPKKAEEFLQKSLALDPFNADARFNYGYAIWRRVDATQLPNMAAQWELALELNPLHYLTHWHWGNGHTNLTYADYVDNDEKEILVELKLAESFVSQNKIDSAILEIRRVSGQYVNSAIPEMMLASVYYMAYDMDRDARLDSARNVFLRILDKKPHYGPAHNGLAAVIKAYRMVYLDSYESLEKEIADTEINDLTSFQEVFPDAAYYPGERVQKMIWNQLHSSVAYFPFLAKLNRVFVIPPLHIDLSRAMRNSYFRGGTTFDNRQWMDIRGVGSGATGIEYVERGAHQERNVTLHEYVHLFHGTLFSDQEMREVRERYYAAMKNDLTLDYYSANNEFEYLAQTYPAYFIETKVHPLNHKSINTRSDLMAKDPLMFAFIDSLVKRQEAYLNGDKSALADNWAEVYMRLANQAKRKNNLPQAMAYLDSALVWDSLYLPVYIQYSELLSGSSQAEEARQWLNKALKINPEFAPIYSAFANLENTRFLNEEITNSTSIKEQTSRYKQALKLETDLGIRAELNQEMRTFYKNYGLISEAIGIAEEYGREAPTVSTYLRDSRDQALAFANELKGSLGYQEESEEFFDRLISLKPQHYYHRAQFARVLIANGNYQKAYQILDEAQKILAAAGNPNPDFIGLMLIAANGMEDKAKVKELLKPVIDKEINLRGNHYLWTEVYLRLGMSDEGNTQFRSIAKPRLPHQKGQYYFLEGMLAEQRKDSERAQKAYFKSIASNVYHIEAHLNLLELLDKSGETRYLKKVANQAGLMPIPPGREILRENTKVLEIVNRDIRN